LRPLIGKAKGVVYNETSEIPVFPYIATAALPNAKVTISFNGIDSIFTATTDANGNFSFDNLPFSQQGSVSAQVINGATSGSDNDSYALTAAGKTLAFSITTTAAPISFLSANYEVVANNKEFDPSSAVILTFSENINATITALRGNILLSNYSGSVGIDVAVSANKLTITPKVKLQNSTSYSISGNVYASETKKTSISGSFTTKITSTTTVLNTTTAPVIAFDATKANVLVSTAAAGTTGYDIYEATPTGEFIYNSSNIGSPTLTLTTTGDATGQRYYVVPIGYDANGNKVRGTQSNILTK
jgi:hypothetical protein